MKQYLALDVGGTKTHIALFSVTKDSRIKITREKKYKTQKAKGLEEILLDFYPPITSIDSICIVLAGPVINDEVTLTNVEWKIQKENIIATTGVESVYLLNDLEASAFSIPFMKTSNVLPIHKAENKMMGNAAIISPGTGLGEAGLYWDGRDFHPFASEGGHCDFSPRDKTDVSLLIFLQHKFGHVSWERLASGKGIVNIFDFLRTSSEYDIDKRVKAAILKGDVAANISKAAESGEQIAIDTVNLFIRYLAIESANLALKFKATGGLHIGGGIIPKIWNKTYESLFLENFFGVGRLEPLLRNIDVTIILNPKSVLLGAAHYGLIQEEKSIVISK